MDMLLSSKVAHYEFKNGDGLILFGEQHSDLGAGGERLLKCCLVTV